MTSAPMMRLYADACVRTQYVHEEARLRVHYKQDHCICVRGFVIWLQRTQRDTLKAAAGSLFGSNHDRQTCRADLFFFVLPLLFQSLSHTNTQSRVTLSTSGLQGIRRKKLFFTSAQSLYIDPKKAHEECGAHHWLFMVDRWLHFL